MPNFHSARPLILLILIPVLLFTGCGSSGSDPDEPPVYSPLQVLVPEAPGKKTLGTSHWSWISLIQIRAISLLSQIPQIR